MKGMPVIATTVVPRSSSNLGLLVGYPPWGLQDPPHTTQKWAIGQDSKSSLLTRVWMAAECQEAQDPGHNLLNSPPVDPKVGNFVPLAGEFWCVLEVLPRPRARKGAPGIYLWVLT